MHDWDGDGVSDVLAGYYSGPWVDPVVDLFLADGSGGVDASQTVLSGPEVTGIRMASPVVP